MKPSHQNLSEYQYKVLGELKLTYTNNRSKIIAPRYNLCPFHTLTTLTQQRYVCSVSLLYDEWGGPCAYKIPTTSQLLVIKECPQRNRSCSVK